MAVVKVIDINTYNNRVNMINPKIRKQAEKISDDVLSGQAKIDYDSNLRDLEILISYLEQCNNESLIGCELIVKALVELDELVRKFEQFYSQDRYYNLKLRPRLYKALNMQETLKIFDTEDFLKLESDKSTTPDSQSTPSPASTSDSSSGPTQIYDEVKTTETSATMVLKKVRFSGESHPDSTSLIAKIESATSVDELIRIEELGGSVCQLAKKRLARQVLSRKSVRVISRPSDIALNEAQLRAKADHFLSQYSEIEATQQLFGTHLSLFFTMYGGLDSFWGVLDSTSHNGENAIKLGLGRALAQDESEEVSTSEQRSTMSP